MQNADRLDIWDAKSRTSWTPQRTGSKRGAWWDRAEHHAYLAPYPNAAKVFLNWLLSREGQIALQKLVENGRNSLRIDIPKDDVPSTHESSRVPSTSCSMILPFPIRNSAPLAADGRKGAEVNPPPPTHRAILQ
jgi:hypothetical protein